MVPELGEATEASRERGGQVSAPNEAGHQGRGRSQWRPPPSARDTPSSERSGRGGAEAGRVRPQQGGDVGSLVLLLGPPGSARPGAASMSVFERLSAAQTGPCRTSSFPSRPKSAED